MPFNLAPIDRALVEGYTLQLTNPDGGIQAAQNIDVDFQFTPHIKSDNKMVNWKEADLRSAEPFSIFMGAKPREITMNWSYIVTHRANRVFAGGVVQNVNPLNAWSIQKISTLVKQIRGFMYQRVSDKLIVRFKAWEIIGDNFRGLNDMSFRSEGISVDYSPTIVRDGNQAWPLKTDLSMKIKLWTNLGDSGDEEAEGTEAVQDINGLKSLRDVKNQAPSWY